MAKLTIRHAEACNTGLHLAKYWHDCEADNCKADECLDCGSFATDCHAENDRAEGLPKNV
jgi:hypothetical protein